jgi:hypothetical protein
MGAKEQRPQLFVGRVLLTQLLHTVDGFFDPGLPVTVELAVDNASV